jgi:membrane protein
VSNSIVQKIDQFVWHSEVSSIAGWQRLSIQFLQIMTMIGKDLSRGMLTLRAMSLVYTTLLSFVPLLAVSFSVLKGFGVHNQIEPMLLNLLEPLGDQSVEITQNIVGFVENMKIGVLGALGLGMLMYTVISLIQKIEAAFNFTWRLSSNRNLSQRFSSYLSVVMVGPVLIFSAIGITASLKSHTIVNAIESLPYMADLIRLAGYFVPYLLIISAFTFVYVLVPNTRVKFTSALYGAIIAGVLWRWTGALFASFAGGSTSYTAIYSGFAILFLFMIWLYLGWLILLIGASISYYHQHPERLRWKIEEFNISGKMRENLALQLMLEIGRAHYFDNDFIPSRVALYERLKIPESMIDRMLSSLQQCGLIILSSEPDEYYLPSRSIEQISLADIVKAARMAEDNEMIPHLKLDPTIDQVQHNIEISLQQSLLDQSLKDLVIDN